MVLEKVPTFQDVKDWAASKTDLNNHINDTNNPHNVSADAPVDDVNGQTGSVNLNYNDVGAKSDSYSAPVDSVNGQTGSVNIPTGLEVTQVASGSTTAMEDGGWKVVADSGFYSSEGVLVDGDVVYSSNVGEFFTVALGGDSEANQVQYEVYELQ